MSTHHSVQWRRLHPGFDFRVGGLHAAFDAAPNVDGWHRKINYGSEFGGGRVHHSSPISYSFEGQDAVREFVIFEPIDKKFRDPAEPLPHCNSPALVVVAKNAKHNATTMRGASASEDAPQAREKSANRIGAGVPVSERNIAHSSFTTGARA